MKGKGVKKMGEPIKLFCINTSCNEPGYRWAFSQDGYTLVCGNNDCLDWVGKHSTKKSKSDLDKIATDLIDEGKKIINYKSMLLVDYSK